MFEKGVIFINKLHIARNSLQETLIVPLYGRKICSEKFPDLYSDLSANQLCNSLDYDFSELEKKKNSLLYEFGALEAAMRQLDFTWEIKKYLEKYPYATIVNLGCGLDETGKFCDNGLCKIVNIDFPDVISLRNKLIPSGPREVNMSCDLKNFCWMNKLNNTEGIILFAAGVFHYFKRSEVEYLLLELSKKFKNACIIFDTVGKFGIKLMKTTLKNMNISNVKGLFYLDNPKRELNLSNNIKVSSKPYMLGYYNMKCRNIKISHRILAKLCDSILKMNIVKIDFI